jgi:hypothetical protein
MNITQFDVDCIIRRLKDDAPDFLEALSDADHYLRVALDLLSRHDQTTIRELVGASDTVYEILGLIQESLDDDDADDDDADVALQEAYDIIAGDDIDPTDEQQLADELMRGWK